MKKIKFGNNFNLVSRTEMIANVDGIGVTWDAEPNEAYINFEDDRIHLPAIDDTKITADLVKKIRGMVDHEVRHKRHTDKEQWLGHVKDFKKRQELQVICNIFEDGRIEAQNGRKGEAINIKNLRIMFANRIIAQSKDKVVDTGSPWADAIVAFMYRTHGIKFPLSDEAETAYEHYIKEDNLFNRILEAEEFEDVYKIAKEFMDKYVKDKKFKSFTLDVKGNGKGKGKGGGDDEKDGGEGKGESLKDKISKALGGGSGSKSDKKDKDGKGKSSGSSGSGEEQEGSMHVDGDDLDEVFKNLQDHLIDKKFSEDLGKEFVKAHTPKKDGKKGGKNNSGRSSSEKVSPHDPKDSSEYSDLDYRLAKSNVGLTSFTESDIWHEYKYLSSFSPSDPLDFNKIKDSKVMKKISSNLVKVLRSATDSYKVHGYANGKKVSQNKLASFSRNLTDKPFYREHNTENLTAKVSVLTDLSGSMGGQKIIDALLFTYLLFDICQKLEIDAEFVGFHAGGGGHNHFSNFPNAKNFVSCYPKIFEVMKPFDTVMTKKQFKNILNQCYTNFENGKTFKQGLSMCSGRQNADGEAVFGVAKRLSEQPEEYKKILFVLSDGQPSAPLNRNVDSDWGCLQKHLKDVVNLIKDRTDIDIFAFGFDGASTVADLYGADCSVYARDFFDIEMELLKQLEKKLLNSLK